MRSNHEVHGIVVKNAAVDHHLGAPDHLFGRLEQQRELASEFVSTTR